MPVYTIFDDATGQPLREVECPENLAQQQARPGERVEEGAHMGDQRHLPVMPSN